DYSRPPPKDRCRRKPLKPRRAPRLPKFVSWGSSSDFRRAYCKGKQIVVRCHSACPNGRHRSAAFTPLHCRREGEIDKKRLLSPALSSFLKRRGRENPVARTRQVFCRTQLIKNLWYAKQIRSPTG